MKYFKNAKEAVSIVKELLQKEDWPALAQYYNLKNSGISLQDASKAEFFLRKSEPQVHHPTDQIIYLRPFDPTYEYDGEEEKGEFVEVRLIKKIDQGGGLTQIGFQTLKLIKTQKGLQLIP